MADEPRVARLHLVPTSGQAGAGTRVAELGDLSTGDGGPVAPARDAVELGRIGSTVPPPVRVARLGSGAARSSPADRERSRSESAERRAGARRIRDEADEVRGDADPPTLRGASGGRPGRRPPGPKQIDPGADPVAAAKDICLDLLTARPRTKHELADALRRRGVPDEAAATALERFDEVGLIDDAAFAGLWVRSRQRTKGLARRALAVELRRKGVDEEIAGEALAEVDADAEELRARELVDRKLRTVPAGTPEQRTAAARRLVGMLARKGYGGAIAYRVVREALAAHGAEGDELGSEPPED